MTTTPARAGSKKATVKASFGCTECGWSTTKWVGRCGECQAWGTVAELGASVARTPTAAVVRAALPIDQVSAETSAHRPTGVGEFDRVLGGGLVAGAVILLAGEPGVGKSTLLLDVAAKAARAGQRVLYLSGEESAGQLRLRAQRIGALEPGVLVADENDLGTVLGHIDASAPDLLIVDSVQTIASAEIEGAAGNSAQVREVAASLIQVAKSRGIPTVLVGHVTKDGTVAGPRTLEHLVDVVCQFEGDRHARLRMIRAVKNRYGPTDEVGCFDLNEDGIIELPDPSGLFLSRETHLAPGACVTVTLEGKRPLVAEIQTLTAPNDGNPRRTTQGVEGGRVAMIQAVLGQHGRLRVYGSDLYVATVGGVRVMEPAADLAIALALASALHGEPMASRTVAFGEVSLSGEVRPVTGVARRLAEASRLGFTTAVVPLGFERKAAPRGMRVYPVGHIRDGLRALWKQHVVPIAPPDEMQMRHFKNSLNANVNVPTQ